jgi:hypothetical protein
VCLIDVLVVIDFICEIVVAMLLPAPELFVRQDLVSKQDLQVILGHLTIPHAFQRRSLGVPSLVTL